MISKLTLMSKRSISYLFLVLGIALVLVSEFQETPSILLQICGLCVLMFSLYQLSKGIEDRPSKDSFIENDEEE
ncbi:hypothetical protein N9551_02285 [Flavobacteriaceae bacterium]|nr:hypothetical protein [Flavobacteriaceae bacterium]